MTVQGLSFRPVPLQSSRPLESSAGSSVPSWQVSGRRREGKEHLRRFEGLATKWCSSFLPFMLARTSSWLYLESEIVPWSQKKMESSSIVLAMQWGHLCSKGHLLPIQPPLPAPVYHSVQSLKTTGLLRRHLRDDGRCGPGLLPSRCLCRR